MMTTVKIQLEREMALNGENWSKVEYMTLTDEELHREFDPGFGSQEGPEFTVWTKRNVYFPAVYDGACWVEAVPRHPTAVAKTHVGGGL